MASDKPFFFLLLLMFLSFKLQSSSSETWIKAGYWDSSGSLPVSDIKSTLFTHLFCAFAFVNSTSYQLFINSSNEQPFSSFTNTVKLKNPSITTLLSIWVARTETTFSLMINETSRRKSFIESSIKIARFYGFHGLDLCGVEPRNGTNMTSLGDFLDEWRAEVASESRSSGKTRLLLTMSTNRLPNVNSVSYPIEPTNRNLDWVNIIAYDYSVPTIDRFTGFHAALYDPSGRANTDAGIREWLNRGFPAEKLVLGLPYHGYGWVLVNSGDNGIGSAASGPAITLDGSMGYKLIKSFIRNYGYGVEPVYNSTYVVNFCKIGSNWINFDDVEAIKAKVSYAKVKGLLGYNAFQLSNDDNWVLSQAAYGGIGTSQQKKPQLSVIVSVTVATIFLLMMVIICYLQKKICKSQGLSGVAKLSVSWIKTKISVGRKHESDDPNLQFFSFSSIKASTNNFSYDNKLGEGGYGPVYKVMHYITQSAIAEDIAAIFDNSNDELIFDFLYHELIFDYTFVCGYVPPEYVKKGIYSTKYDVYSFGVVLLQIISGKRNSSDYGCHENLNLLEYAYELWKQGRGAEFFDASLDDSSSSCKLTRCMQVALLCVQENAADRPSMVEVFNILKNESSVAVSTPKQPAYSVTRDDNRKITELEGKKVFSVNDASITQVVPR
ncbi:hypothetical protein V6N13_136337 [Hibiscus sabdariffa]